MHHADLTTASDLLPSSSNMSWHAISCHVRDGQICTPRTRSIGLSPLVQITSEYALYQAVCLVGNPHSIQLMLFQFPSRHPVLQIPK